MDGALRLGRISSNWDSLFKGALSQHTLPEALNGSTLTVSVDSPAWLQETRFHKSAMLSRLSPYGVRELRFRLGSVRRDAPPPQCEPRAREAGPDDILEVEGMVSEIGDDDLRESIRTAALRSLTGYSRRQSQCGELLDGAIELRNPEQLCAEKSRVRS